MSMQAAAGSYAPRVHPHGPNLTGLPLGVCGAGKSGVCSGRAATDALNKRAEGDARCKVPRMKGWKC